MPQPLSWWLEEGKTKEYIVPEDTLSKADRECWGKPYHLGELRQLPEIVSPLDKITEKLDKLDKKLDALINAQGGYILHNGLFVKPKDMR